jgi:putative endonuclease
LYSEKLEKYYAGCTDNLERRLSEHNRGKSKFTHSGVPWLVVHSIEIDSLKNARKIERQIKEFGIKRYIEQKFFKIQQGQF